MGAILSCIRSIFSPRNDISPVTEERHPTYLLERGEIYVALYNYEARMDNELSFQTGERLILIDKTESRDWWLLRSSQTGRQGYGPSNHITELTADLLQLHEWYVGGIGRTEAARRLMVPTNSLGTFLVRNSETHPGCLVLCILHEEIATQRTIMQYRIWKDSTDGKFFITRVVTFNNVADLVEYYSRTRGELCRMLGQPCPTHRNAPISISRANDVFEVNPRSLRKAERLGEGHFSEVYRGYWNENFEVAIKIMANGTMSAEQFRNEANIMKDLHHDNLVRLLCVVSYGSEMRIVMEYMKNGNLLQYLRGGGGQDNLLEQQVASGMSYLEERNFVHRDVRAANILVGERGIYKVGDFGLARLIIDQEYQANGSTFPVRWTAIEGLMHRRFTTKSDVWSYGVLLYEIFSKGQEPYSDKNNWEILPALRSGVRLPQPAECPIVEMHRIMLRCWEFEPSNRPTFAELKTIFESMLMK